jgi:hypothetical protein
VFVWKNAFGAISNVCSPDPVVHDAGTEHGHDLLPEGGLRDAGVDRVRERGDFGELGAEKVGVGRPSARRRGRS